MEGYFHVFPKDLVLLIPGCNKMPGQYGSPYVSSATALATGNSNLCFVIDLRVTFPQKKKAGSVA